MLKRIGSRLPVCIAIVAALAACGGASGGPPKLDVDPSALDFGYSVINARASLAVELSNHTEQAKTLTLRIEGEHAADFSVAPQVSVAAGASQSVEVAFAAGDSGPRTASLRFASATDSGSIELRGFGTRPQLSVAPVLDFGAALGGDSRTLRIANAGPAVSDTTADNLLFPAPPALSGADAEEFGFEWPPSGFDPTVGIAPGEAVELQVWLERASDTHVREPGPQSATFTIFSNDPAHGEVEVTVNAEAADNVPCTLEVSPKALLFGTPPGSADTRSFRIRQLLRRACAVTLLGPPTGSPFQLGAGPALAIPGQGEVDVPVTFKPTVESTVRATVRVISGADATVELVGAPNAGIVVEPALLDFGDAPCPGPEQAANLANFSSAPVQFETFELSGSQDFTLTQRPALPKTVASGEVLEWKVIYRPTDVGEDVATLTVRGPAQTATLQLRGRRSADRPIQTDVFQMEPREKVDLLFVIDDSPSMADKQQALATNFASFFRFADAQQFDYHLAVTTTAVDAAHGGTGSGADFANGRFVPLTGTGPRVITPTTPDKAQAFGQNAAVGASSASDGFLLRPVQLALSEPLLSTHNAGFLRDDANLAVIVITDGADHDSEQVSTFANFLVALKGFQHATMFSFNAILPTLAQAPAGCTYDEPTAGLSTRLKELVSRTGGVYDEICTPDWAKTLEKIGRLCFGCGYRTRFYLSNVPDLTIPDPIVVRIDGLDYPQYGAFGDKRWGYNSMANAIDFEPLAVPDPDSTLSVTYPVACRPWP